MKISTKTISVWILVMGLTALSLDYCFSGSPETTHHQFTIKQKDPAQWFEEKGIKKDFESVSDLALNHSDADFRYHALKLLKSNYAKQSTEIFLELAESDPDLSVRDLACLALFKLKDKRVIPLYKNLIGDVASLSRKISIGMLLLHLGDLSGLKYVLEAKDSSYTSDRYLSSVYMPRFFEFREEIIEEQGLDLLEIYLQFGKDPYTPVRQNFVIYWPEKSVPEELQKKFIELASKIAESDPDKQVRIFAKMRVGGLEVEFQK